MVSLFDLQIGLMRERIIRDINQAGLSGKVCLVGGAIREIALGRSPKDFDIVLSATEDLKVIERVFKRDTFVLGKRPFQARRIVKDGISIDITFLTNSIEEDLKRRDFTINAIAYDIKEDKIIDVVGGLEALKARVIIYTSQNALKEDPIRLLKAIRHFATLPNFYIHKDLMHAIAEFKSLISGVAPERIKQELDQIVMSTGIYSGIKAMEETGLILEIFPELLSLKELDIEKGFVLETYGHTIEGFKYLDQMAGLYKLDEAARKVSAYSLLFHDLGKPSTYSFDEKRQVVHFFNHERVSKEIATPIMERLRFSTNHIKAITTLIKAHMRIFLLSSNQSPLKAVKRLVYRLGDLIPPLIVLTLCDLYGSSGGKENPSTLRIEAVCRDIFEQYIEWKKKPLPRLITGHDLIAMGYKEGPQIGKALAVIRERQLSGELTEREMALSYARELLQKYYTDSSPDIGS
jgi:tRNA nucleotidyltransferase/poly(A) polymerase